RGPEPLRTSRPGVDQADADPFGHGGGPSPAPHPAGPVLDDAATARLEMEQIEMARVDLAPIDRTALDADDALIEALAGGRLSAEDLHPEPIGPDDELVAMLAAWVADVNPDPLDGALSDDLSGVDEFGPGSEVPAFDPVAEAELRAQFEAEFDAAFPTGPDTTGP